MSKLAAILGLLAGTSLLLYRGGEAPHWLLKLECLGVMTGALGLGFARRNARLPAWTRDGAVRGVSLVYLGVGAVFVDLNLIASAFLIGSGLRLVMRSAGVVTARVVHRGLDRRGSDLVIRKGGGLGRRP